MGINEAVAAISKQIHSKKENRYDSDVRFVTVNGKKVRLDGDSLRDKADLAAEIVFTAFSEPGFKGPVTVTIFGSNKGRDYEYTIEFIRAGNGHVTAKQSEGIALK